MSTQAALGQKALDDKNFAAAVKHYTEALKDANSPLWLIKRSTAYTREGHHDLALRDAEQAILAAMSRGRREQIATAQLRRAIALFNLKRYGDARICFTWVRKLNEKEKGLGMWQAKVVMEYDKLEDDDERRKVTVKETPDKIIPVVEQVKSGGQMSSTSAAAEQMPVSSSVQTAKEKIRTDWYQSDSKVTITIFAKNVPKDKVEVEMAEYSLYINFPTAASESYDYSLDPLYGKIDVSKSTVNVTASKIEILLHKKTGKDSSGKWGKLEGDKRLDAESSSPNPLQTLLSSAANKSEEPEIPKKAEAKETKGGTGKPQKGPVYPTSSRKGAKDWDAVAKEALKKESKARKDGKDSNAEMEDADEADPLGGFFKQLYEKADPDTKRAMMKSYVESNGTALSTNWAEVGAKTVETTPPDGMEAKKWS